MSLDKSYSILTDPKFNKYVKKNLPSQLKKILDRKIQYFIANPHHNGLNTKKYGVSDQTLKQCGVDEIWEFYIDMRFRCVFYVIHEQRTMIIAFVGNHEDVERRYG